eukprot:GGOE01015274.1.p1 GENE.GGOE01015274.1~~GGOE01015274.1.p1  ORF type:complete len:430 (+),score=87.23 GGOE01015274.1:124-1413(+)
MFTERNQMATFLTHVCVPPVLLLLLVLGWLTQRKQFPPVPFSFTTPTNVAPPAMTSALTNGSFASTPKVRADHQNSSAVHGTSIRFQHEQPAVPQPPVVTAAIANSPPVYVALSATFGEQYAFYLPLTVLVWKELGIGSIVFLVGNRWNNPVGKFIVDTIKEFGAIVSFMPVPAHIPLTIVAQHARFYAPWLPRVAPDAILITSDADIWPFHASLYALDTAQFDVRVVDCFAFSFFRIIVQSENGRLIRRFKTVHPSRENVSGYVVYPQFPITNIIMNARRWRQVLNVTFADSALSAENVWEALTSFLGYAPSVLQASRRGPLWFSDQFFISAKIMELNYAKQLRVQLVPRRTRADRLGPKGIWCLPERGMDCAMVRRVNDSHNPRNPHLKGQQRCLLGILRCILPPLAMRQAERITQRYLALRRPPKA